MEDFPPIYKRKSDYVKDNNVRDVINLLAQRAEVGYSKYGVTTERTDIDLHGWLQHLIEELCDAAIYARRLQREHSKNADAS